MPKLWYTYTSLNTMYCGGGPELASNSILYGPIWLR